jgi:hypothetical protein
MFRLLYASLKYFSLGLVIGLLTAPRTGRESRRLVWDQARALTGDWFRDMTGCAGSAGRSGAASRTNL